MLSKAILSLPRDAKCLIVLGVDLVLLPFALWASFSLRLCKFYLPITDITNPDFIRELMLQPTTFLENKSITTAR